MGTGWTAPVVVIQVVLILVIGALAQDVKQVRNADRASRVDRLLEHQQQPGPTRQVSLRGVPQSVVAALVKASRQYVLQESPKELDTGYPLLQPGDGRERLGQYG